jgi:hypothetical protein
LRTWVFVVEIANKFVLGLDVLRAHYTSVDLGHHELRQGEEELLLWRPGA